MRLSAPARKPQSAADRAARRLLPRALTLWPPQPDWRLATVESVLLMLLALALSVWLRPADPFWSGVGFPWLWLISTLVALRHGALLGVIVLGVAVAAWFGLSALGPTFGEFPRVSFLGALLLVLIAGEFSDVWNARLNQAQAVNAFVDERLQVLTHNHFLLSVSHERLEQELISRPYTLRETLATLRGLMLQPSPGRAVAANDEAALDDPPSPLIGAAWLMGLLVQQCRLEAAALFAVTDGNLVTEPAATAGSFAPLDTADPMLASALEGGQLTHLQSDLDLDIGFGDRTGSASRYQVCAPLITSGGQIIGVLVIERMAFIALNLETLQLLTVVLAYYADGTDQVVNARPLLAAHPQCPPEFAAEWGRLARINMLTALRSSVLAFSTRLDNAEGVDSLARIERLRRSLDLYWPSTRGPRRVLLVLLPLTDEVGLRGYLDRVDTVLREQLGRDLEEIGLAVFTASVDERPALSQLNGLLERTDA
jgi:hypothetical protein